jgi:hypothetical protein
MLHAILTALSYLFVAVGMATTFRPKYGTSNQSITITLASLGASATVGRASTAVDNSSNLFDDVLVSVLVESGTVSGNKQALVYVYGTADGGTTYTEGITGADAGFTRNDPTNLRLLGVIPMPTNATVYKSGPFSVAAAFGGVLPDHWGIAVFNDSGAALSATAGNNKAFYQGVQVEGA